MKTSHMTEDERKQLADLERTLNAGLQQALRTGQALTMIRDRQLYREEFETFEAYCSSRWKLSKSRAYQLIAFATVSENVQPAGHELTSKAAVHLATLPAQQQREAFADAAADVEPGQAVPARAVKEAAEKRKTSKRRRRPPKATRIRVPGGIVIIERKDQATEIADLLRAALTKVSELRKAA